MPLPKEYIQVVSKEMNVIIEGIKVTLEE